MPELTIEERDRLRAFVAAAAAAYAPHRNRNATPGAKSRLMAWPIPMPSANDLALVAENFAVEDVDIWLPDGTPGQVRLYKGTTNYVQASDEWASMEYVLAHMIRHCRLTREEAYKLLPTIYHMVYGVVTAVRRTTPGGERLILAGIRASADKIAGMNTGTLSLPGGLVNSPDENIRQAAYREFRGEGGMNVPFVLRPCVTFGPHNAAPSVTFVALGDVNGDVGEIGESFEWQGRRMVWLPEELLQRALENPDDHGPLTCYLLEAGIEVDRAVIAGDVADPLRRLLTVYPD